MTAVRHYSVFTGWMPFLPPNQHRQSTEGSALKEYLVKYLSSFGLEVFDGLLSVALCTSSKSLTVITLFVGHRYNIMYIFVMVKKPIF